MNRTWHPIPEIYFKSTKTWAFVLLILSTITEIGHKLVFDKFVFGYIYYLEKNLSYSLIIFIYNLLSEVVIFLLVSGIYSISNKNKVILFVLGLFLALLGYFYNYKILTLSLLLTPFTLIFTFDILSSFLIKNYKFKISNNTLKFSVILAIWFTFIPILAAGALRLGIVFNPVVHDSIFYKIDSAFVFSNGRGWAATIFNLFQTLPTPLQTATKIAYLILPVLFLPSIALLFWDKKLIVLNGWRALLISFVLAWACYAWLPGVGPTISFYTPYKNQLPAPQDVIPQLQLASFALKNVMPSLHLFSAILIMMIMACLSRKWLFILAIGYVLITVWTTLALGEHYIIDLIVALSFIAAFGTLLTYPPYWKRPGFLWGSIWVSCFIIFFGWMLIMKLAPAILYEHLNFTRIFAAITVMLSITMIIHYIQSVWRIKSDFEQSTQIISHTSDATVAFNATIFLPISLLSYLTGKRWVIVLSFLLGFSSFIYQTVCSKAFTIMFGSTILVSYTVLFVYITIMAVGILVGGIIADRIKFVRSILYLCMFFTLITGLYIAVTPTLLHIIEKLYVFLTINVQPGSVFMVAFHISLITAILIIPILLIGATLSLAYKYLIHNIDYSPIQILSPLYGAHILGAALGALCVTYIFLPHLGRLSTTLVSALICLLITLYVYNQHKKLGSMPDSNLTLLNLDKPCVNAVVCIKNSVTWQGRIATLILLIGSCVALAIQVIHTFLLAAVAGDSIYTYGLISTIFLFGFGLGSIICKILVRTLTKSTVITWALCGLAITLTATSFLWDTLPDYFAYFGQLKNLKNYNFDLTFLGRELIRGMVCSLIVLPSSFFIGIIFPALLELTSTGIVANKQTQYGLGSATSIGLASCTSVIGGIAGFVLVGFIFMPAYGSNTTLHSLAAIAVILAMLMFIAEWTLSLQTFKLSLKNCLATIEKSGFLNLLVLTSAAIVLAFASLLIWPRSWNYTLLSSGSSVYFQPSQWGMAIDYTESIENGLTSINRKQLLTKDDSQHASPISTLLVNGQLQGNDTISSNSLPQEANGLISLLHQSNRDNALVIGYGTGEIPSVLRSQGFKYLDIAENSHDVVLLADRQFSSINRGISGQPNVNIFYTNGRNYLLTQNKLYDLISVTIPSILYASEASFYNQEFYELAARRLKNGGVMQQMVSLVRIRPIDFVTIVNSARTNFRYISLYVLGEQGFLLMTNDEHAATQNITAENILRQGLEISQSTLKISDLKAMLIANPTKMDWMIKQKLGENEVRLFISTDNNLKLAYELPKGNASNTTMQEILKLFD
jgi:spermidine synthase